MKTFSVPIATGLKVKDMGAGCFISEILAFNTTKIQVSTTLVAFKSDKELCWGGWGWLTLRKDTCSEALRVEEAANTMIELPSL